MMYILPTLSQLILIILDFLNSPSVGPQALEGLKHGLLKASARGSGVGRGAGVG